MRQEAPPPITVAAAIILDADRRMLVVRKRGTNVFMQPGGKIESGEPPLAALRRELSEEIGVSLAEADARLLGVFSAPAANEDGRQVVAHIFAADTLISPEIAAEIEEMRWIDPAAPGEYPLAPLTRDHMLPLARSLQGPTQGGRP